MKFNKLPEDLNKFLRKDGPFKFRKFFLKAHQEIQRYSLTELSDDPPPMEIYW